MYSIIGYYATREEGMIALAEYNKNPYDIQNANLTLKEVYNKWSEMILPKLGTSLSKSLKVAYKHIQKLDNMRYKDIRSYHMQETIDSCGRGHSTQAQIKNLWYHLDKLAMELDIINKMYSQLTTSEPAEETHKLPFSEDEINILWEHVEDPWIDTILIMLYSGWRIQEFYTLKNELINLEERTMQGGIKTKSGKNRIVPIHSRIFPLVQARFNADSEFFLTDSDGNPMIDSIYRKHFTKALQKLGINHTPHETRHTFRSRLDSAGGNKRCIDLMMGHKSKDIGERVYTHKTVDELRETIELLK